MSEMDFINFYTKNMGWLYNYIYDIHLVSKVFQGVIPLTKNNKPHRQGRLMFLSLSQGEDRHVILFCQHVVLCCVVYPSECLLCTGTWSRDLKETKIENYWPHHLVIQE